MDRFDINERFAKMWRKSRDEAGKSQEFMARSLGVSKKTVQNWEAGTSCPSQEKGFEWFQVLGIQPLPYYLELIYPDEFCQLSFDDSDQMIEDALITIIKNLPSGSKRKLLYLLYGNHGSSPLAMLELITAHLQTPLRARLNVAEIVRTNYEIADAMGILAQPDHIQPDVDVLNHAFLCGKDAVKQGLRAYTSMMKDGDDHHVD